MIPQNTSTRLLLQVRGLKRHFPLEGGLFESTRTVKAVDGVDLEIKEGETLGVNGGAKPSHWAA